MHEKALILMSLCLMLLFLTAFSAQPLYVANANFCPPAPPTTLPPPLPSIVIGSDGSITPKNAPISRTGNVYTLTADVINCSLNIECDNIMVDGAGHTITADPDLWSHYYQTSGIALHASQVTIRNMNITQFSFQLGGIKTYGSNNTIINNNITADITLASHYNNIIGNTLRGYKLRIDSNFNTIVGNTIEGSYQPVALPGVHNIFYLNNFVNSTRGYSAGTNNYVAPLWWQLTLNGKPVPEAEWTPETTWMPLYPNDTAFDNGSVGNYWSDYNGTDADGDGIGDTPYIIGGNLKDYHPLMSPVNISEATLPFDNPSTQPSPSPSPQNSNLQAELICIVAVGVAVTAISTAVALFRKRK